jgi:hypothetical protein
LLGLVLRLSFYYHHHHHHHHHHHPFMQGIHTYIPETNRVSTVYSVAAILRVLLTVIIIIIIIVVVVELNARQNNVSTSNDSVVAKTTSNGRCTHNDTNS